MRFGSLFSGIGGLDLGLERAGMECAWQVENDSYAVRVLAKHWPNIPKYGDIQEVDFERVEPVELLAGGFPCQDLSYAGKGLGLSGPRSGLWSEFKRAIRVVRPRYVLVENIPGLLSRGMGAVLGDLASLGYDAEWQSLPAAAFGAPHLRWRVFIVAHSRHAERGQGEHPGDVANGQVARRPQEAGRAGAPGSNGRAGTLANPAWIGRREDGPRQPLAHGEDVPDADRKRWDGRAGVFGQERRRESTDGRNFGRYAREWGAEPSVGRVANGVPSRVDRLRGLGNAVVPQVAEFIGRCILEAEKNAA